METLTVDLSDWDKTRDTFQGIKDIDMLVNNAGIDQAFPFLDVPREAMEKYVDFCLIFAHLASSFFKLTY